jgi:hypothetical protein
MDQRGVVSFLSSSTCPTACVISRALGLMDEQTMDEEARQHAALNWNRILHQPTHWPVRTCIPCPSSTLACLAHIGSNRMNAFF